MIWRAALMLIWLGAPVAAETVVVKSGEHADFSRLVLALPEALDWQFGRTAAGYELALAGEEQRFDVSGVFDLIPRRRLTGIYADPATGKLQLTVQCDCHALPFSLDARTIVIDLRDGPAPARSGFEVGLDGAEFPPLAGIAPPMPRPQRRALADGPVYDWLAQPQPVLPEPAALDLPAPVDAGDDIRAALVTQLAEGAARGVVELAVPAAVQGDAPFLPDDVQLRLTDMPGLQIGAAPPEGQALMPDGEACIADDMLDLAAWGDPADAEGQLAMIHAGLVGEFDTPQPEAVLAAVRRYLFLGFGAEARNLLAAFPVDRDEAWHLADMARIMDGDAIPVAHAFAGMASCDTVAALWSFLAAPVAEPDDANSDAIKRAFSALPQHLRLHLGPGLAERLIAVNRADVAQEVSVMMGRGAAQDQRAAGLVRAELALEAGEGHLAVAEAEEVLADAGPLGPAAMVRLIDGQVAAGAQIEAAVAETVLAMLAEHEGHDLQPDLARAYLRALAGSGQFAALFAAHSPDEIEDTAIWTLFAARATDDDLLTHALIVPAVAVAPETAVEIAGRLAGLGFPDAAADWRAKGGAGPSAAADAPPGDATNQQTRWSQDWPALAVAGDDSWGQLAAGLAPVAASEPPLATATQLLADSAATRALVDTLLTETAAAND